MIVKDEVKLYIIVQKISFIFHFIQDRYLEKLRKSFIAQLTKDLALFYKCIKKLLSDIITGKILK